MTKQTYVDAMADHIRKVIKPGDNLTLETSNETGTLDANGRYVTTSYSQERHKVTTQPE